MPSFTSKGHSKKSASNSKSFKKTRAPRAERAEVKYFDSNFGSVGVPAGPASLIDATIINIVNGTGPSDRVGRRIRVVGIDYSTSVILLAGNANDVIQFDIWQDRQSNGNTAAPAELYTAIAGAQGTCQFPYLPNEKRFKRLIKRTVSFNSQNVVGGVALQMAEKVEGHIKCNFTVEYNASTGNVTDIVTNNVFTSWSSNIGACQTATVACRIRYVDV